MQQPVAEVAKIMTEIEIIIRAHSHRANVAEF